MPTAKIFNRKTEASGIKPDAEAAEDKIHAISAEGSAVAWNGLYRETSSFGEWTATLEGTTGRRDADAD